MARRKRTAPAPSPYEGWTPPPLDQWPSWPPPPTSKVLAFWEWTMKRRGFMERFTPWYGDWKFYDDFLELLKTSPSLSELLNLRKSKRAAHKAIYILKELAWHAWMARKEKVPARTSGKETGKPTGQVKANLITVESAKSTLHSYRWLWAEKKARSAAKLLEEFCGLLEDYAEGKADTRQILSRGGPFWISVEVPSRKRGRPHAPSAVNCGLALLADTFRRYTGRPMYPLVAALARHFCPDGFTRSFSAEHVYQRVLAFERMDREEADPFWGLMLDRQRKYVAREVSRLLGPKPNVLDSP